MHADRFHVRLFFYLMTMTEKDTNQIKEELIENISELFLKYGLRSTSMDDICTHLKISKKTLYQFFTNKDDVVEQVMIYRSTNRKVLDNLEKLRRQNSIEAIIQIKKHIISDLSSRLPANMFDIKKYHPEVYARITEMNSELINDILKNILNNGINNNLFRNDINHNVQIYLFIKQMSFLGDPEMFSNIIYPLDIIVSTIVDNFIRSISTPEGITELEKKIKQIEKKEQESM